MSEKQKKELAEDRAFDAGLAEVMGGRFQDMSGTAKPAPKKQTQSTRIKTAAEGRGLETSNALDGQREPVATYAPHWYDKLKLCAKWAMLFGGLVGLLAYWNFTGQMAASAAIPSMVVCGVVGGFKVGSVCRK